MSNSKVLQFSDARKEQQENIKREYERVLFSRILGCYTVIEKLGIKAVEMHDISKTGLSFRMDASQGAFNMGEEVDFRFYFSNSTYIPARLTIKRKAEVLENGVKFWEYGGSFDKELSTYTAIERFVEFINAYVMAAKEDRGDTKFWF